MRTQCTSSEQGSSAFAWKRSWRGQSELKPNVFQMRKTKTWRSFLPDPLGCCLRDNGKNSCASPAIHGQNHLLCSRWETHAGHKSQADTNSKALPFSLAKGYDPTTPHRHHMLRLLWTFHKSPLAGDQWHQKLNRGNAPWHAWHAEAPTWLPVEASDSKNFSVQDTPLATTGSGGKHLSSPSRSSQSEEPVSTKALSTTSNHAMASYGMTWPNSLVAMQLLSRMKLTSMLSRCNSWPIRTTGGSETACPQSHVHHDLSWPITKSETCKRSQTSIAKTRLELGRKTRPVEWTEGVAAAWKVNERNHEVHITFKTYKQCLMLLQPNFN